MKLYHITAPGISETLHSQQEAMEKARKIRFVSQMNVQVEEYYIDLTDAIQIAKFTGRAWTVINDKVTVEAI